jgi:signal peptidase II
MTAKRSGRGRLVVLLLLALLTVGCDRVTKQAAVTMLAGAPEHSYLSDVIRLNYAENPGGFLSLGAALPPPGRVWIFTIGTGAMLLVLVGLAVARRNDTASAAGLTLFFAGGLSNWIDRVAHGSVVDFLNLGIGPVRTGIFNVADVAILTGTVLVVIAEWRRRRTSVPESSS